MITIHLHNLLFYSYHGFHEEEKIIGNEYEVNVDMQFHEQQNEINALSETINYADVYAMVKQRMAIPTQLLETVVMDIGNTIAQKYKNILSINIRLQKLHPPIEGMQGSAGVSWHKHF